MVVKLGGLDALKQRLKSEQERLDTEQKKLTVISSEDTWSKIRTNNVGKVCKWP